MEKVNHLSKFHNSGRTADRGADKSIRAEEPSREFSRAEEVAHSVTHGAGAILGILGLILLIIKAIPSGAAAIVGASVFGAALEMSFQYAAIA